MHTNNNKKMRKKYGNLICEGSMERTAEVYGGEDLLRRYVSSLEWKSDGVMYGETGYNDTT